MKYVETSMLYKQWIYPNNLIIICKIAYPKQNISSDTADFCLNDQIVVFILYKYKYNILYIQANYAEGMLKSPVTEQQLPQ